MGVEFSLYEGFLIADYQEDNVKAYRNRAYYAGNTTSYETSSLANIKLMIDDAGDHGDFAEQEYNTVMQMLGRATINVCDLEAPEQVVHQWGPVGGTLAPGVYDSLYGNAISWDGQVAFDLDMGEEVDFSVIIQTRFIRALD